MPRDAVAVTALSASGGTAEGAGVTIAPANNANITGVTKGRKLILRVHNSTGSTKNLTVKAGVNPPAFRSGIGDLVVAHATTVVRYYALESARFLQADGTINVDFETGMTGTIWAFMLPDGV